MAETKLERAERRVQEGADHVHRQKIRIERFAHAGQTKMLTMAYEVLRELEGIQVTFESYLDECRSKSLGNQKPDE